MRTAMTVMVGLLAAAMLGIFASLMCAAIGDERAWQEYKQRRHCKVVSYTEVTTFSNVGMAATPDKVVWLCDDDVTIYR